MQTPGNNNDPKPKKKKKKQGPTRAYKGSDVDTLIIGLIICDNALAHQPQLVNRRSRLIPKFITDLRADIAEAIKDDLGLNPEAALLQATSNVLTTAAEIKDYLVDFYQDLRDGYARDKARFNTISAALGFSALYDAVRNDSQQALGQLIVQFDKNMTPELLAELTDPAKADISATLISNIRNNVNFFELNVTQETLKGTSAELTVAQIEKFNDLYRRYMDVARLGRSVFRRKPTTAEKFSYSQIRRKLHGGEISRPTDTPATT